MADSPFPPAPVFSSPASEPTNSQGYTVAQMSQAAANNGSLPSSSGSSWNYSAPTSGMTAPLSGGSSSVPNAYNPNGTVTSYNPTSGYTYAEKNLNPAYNTNPAFNQGTNYSTIQQGDPATFTANDTDRLFRLRRDQALEETNRQKLLSSGELTPGVAGDLAQEKINLATYGVGNPTFGAAITSTQANDIVNGLGSKANSELQALNAQSGFAPLTTPQYKTYSDYTADIEAARTKQDDIYGLVKQNIESDYSSRTTTQMADNRVQMGAAMKSLARIGALGNSASGIAYIRSVDNQNQDRINKLLNEKQSSLISAMQAYEANDYKLLAAKISESKAITDQYNNVQGQMFDDAMKTNDQIMKQARFGWDNENRIMGKLSAIAATAENFDALDPLFIRQQEVNANLPEGYTRNVWAQAKKERDAKNETDAMTNEKSWLEILASTPKGQKVEVNGRVGTGFKENPITGLYTSTVTDEQGNVTLYSYNPQEKSVFKQSLGNIGKPEEGWQSYEGSDGLYAVNIPEGIANPVMTKGGAINPGSMPGFDEWRASMGTTTVAFGGSTGFEAVHPAYDIANKVGTPITAFAGGTVINTDPVGAGGFGKFVEIQDAEGKVWRYSHLNNFSAKVGDTVNSGSTFAQMGNTGNVITGGREATADDKAAGKGAHLDLRVFAAGKQVSKPQTTTTNNLTQPDMQMVVNDMTRVNAYTSAEEKAAAYSQVRTQVSTMGTNALKWFDEAFPAGNYGVKETTPVVKGLTNSDTQSVTNDISQVRNITDTTERANKYNQIRDNIALRGSDALTWFDKAFPSKDFVGTATKAEGFSDMTLDNRNALSKPQVIAIAKRDGTGFKQLMALLTPKDGKPFQNFTGEDIVDIAKATGGSYEDVKSLLAGGFDGPFDAFTPAVRDYAKQQFGVK